MSHHCPCPVSSLSVRAPPAGAVICYKAVTCLNKDLSRQFYTSPVRMWCDGLVFSCLPLVCRQIQNAAGSGDGQDKSVSLVSREDFERLRNSNPSSPAARPAPSPPSPVTVQPAQQVSTHSQLVHSISTNTDSPVCSRML